MKMCIEGRNMASSEGGWYCGKCQKYCRDEDLDTYECDSDGYLELVCKACGYLVEVKEKVMDEAELRELKAYKMGYDLGWARCSESIMPLLQELQDCMAHSSTWRTIEQESANGQEPPVFMAKIMTVIQELQQLKREMMPALVLEQKAINDMGKRLEALTKMDWEKISQGGLSFKQVEEKNGKS